MILSTCLALAVLAPAPQFLAFDGEVVLQKVGQTWSAPSLNAANQRSTSFTSSAPFKRATTRSASGLVRQGNRLMLGGTMASTKGVWVSGKAPVAPKIRGRQPGDEEILNQLLALLDLKEVEANAYVSQVYNVDLDRQEGDERLVDCGSLGYPGSQRSTYSCVIAFPSDYRLSDLPIEMVFHAAETKTPLCRIAAITDLDGDGKIEVVVTETLGNKGKISLWNWEGEGMKKIAEGSFGSR